MFVHTWKLILKQWTDYLRQKFLNDRNSKMCYHSLKDHPKVSKIVKFRCEML